MSTEQSQRWLCFQLGAREHYAIPRALHSRGLLARMVTDVWLPPAHPLRWAPSKAIRQRWHPGLAGAPVKAWSWSALSCAACHRRMKVGWDRTIATNAWFAGNAAKWLRRSSHELDAPGKVFSYSYTALPVFEIAKALGRTTILGQTNGGPAEEKVVRELHERYPRCGSNWKPAPPSYWADWRREIDHADMIVVNSEWSKSMLMEQGIPANRVTVIPLAYSPPVSSTGFQRSYPTRFDSNHPMRVLFLGQINLRKGVMLLIEAARMIRSQSIEFILVGPDHLGIEREIRGMPNVRWHGTVSRLDVETSYRNADVFLFPTHSDGFGLTQLEAQAWKLPLIVSKHCGAVVSNGINGIVIEDLSAEAIASVLVDCLKNPGMLAHFSEQSVDMASNAMDVLGDRLLHLCPPHGAGSLP